MGSAVVQAHESKLYTDLAHIYDKFFGRLFSPRINMVIRSLNIPPGASVLELGVGTGVSLDAYPPHCHVLGIDLAPEMLEHAQEKIDRNGWKHIQLAAMDAMDLDLPDASFDYVMAFHVVSVVPDVARLMNEALRVLRPGGTLVVINHFRSEKPILAAIDKAMEPLTRRWGWHTLDRREVFGNLALRVERSYKTSRYSLFTIVIGRNESISSEAAPRVAAAR